jgi:hypothetical protein
MDNRVHFIYNYLLKCSCHGKIMFRPYTDSREFPKIMFDFLMSTSPLLGDFSGFNGPAARPNKCYLDIPCSARLKKLSANLDS